MPKKKPLFSRGYKEVREKVAQGSKFVRSCFNCAYYFQCPGDKEEVCQNTDVLQYDMVVEGNNVYCLKWKPSTTNPTKQQAIFKRGRSRLD